MESTTIAIDKPKRETVESQDLYQSLHRDSSPEAKQDLIPKVWTKSRKISKKRNKYQKIDDEIRLKLVEAVEKNGEMLKTAAKRFKINYSSAKSIFHTYRKEGRILKKLVKDRYKKKSSLHGVTKPTPSSPFSMQATQQKNTNSPQIPSLNNMNSMPNMLQNSLSSSLLSNLMLSNPMQQLNSQTSPSTNMMSNSLNEQGISSYNKTMDVLLTLKKLQNIQQQRINFAGINTLAEKMKNQNMCGINSPSSLNSTLNSIQQSSFQSPISSHLQAPIPSNQNQTKSFSMDQNLFMNNAGLSMRNFPTLLPNNSSKSSGSPSSQTMGNSMFNKPKTTTMDLESLIESLQQGNRAEKGGDMEQEVQIESSVRFIPEFECKKEMGSRNDTSDEGASTQNDNRKDGIIRPDAIKETNQLQLNSLSPIQQLDNNLKSFKMQKMEGESPFKNTLETAALDTIKTALSAQLLLGEALKKAALLNNLMNMQVNCTKS